MHWYKSNGMKANPNKFQLILLSRNKNKQKLKLDIENNLLESQDCVKLLGVIIDKQLSFKDHINSICDVAQNRTNALYRVRKYLNYQQANILANSFVISNFNYCNLVWMFCSKRENARINQIHKRVLRCVFNSPHQSLEELLNESNSFDIHTKNLQSLLLFMYKIIKQDCPMLATEFFEVKNMRYNLRSNTSFRLPECRSTNFGINTVFFKGGIVWNNLPYEIKNINDFHSFAKKVKMWKPKCSCKLCM